MLPKGVSGTGISFLDPFEVMRNLFSTRAADLGLMIMTLMGFAHYMDHIGANEAVVRVVTRPLRTLRFPPMFCFFFSYLFASLLQPGYPLSYRTCCFTDGNHVSYYARTRLSAASAAG